jgi:hypothetical protein
MVVIYGLPTIRPKPPFVTLQDPVCKQQGTDVRFAHGQSARHGNGFGLAIDNRDRVRAETWQGLTRVLACVPRRIPTMRKSVSDFETPLLGRLQKF